MTIKILEMDTYTYHGHSMSDPGSTYRTRDEISSVRQEHDPVERIRKLVLSHGLATEKELKYDVFMLNLQKPKRFSSPHTPAFFFMKVRIFFSFGPTEGCVVDFQVRRFYSRGFV
ncbi:Pyruvate dehydrogenase E1 component subunit alpha mitochondrial-like [Forsythia ovata]|uniref:Pyruvate dehydrogenase E1 component subunit alpha mitochondrial-like n=1 Tax=Forsythia ovata TaxID=205694 RepID=A0ABD1WDG8_9LAMI